MGRRRQACSQLSLLWTEVTPPLLATVPICSLLQFICYLVCKLFSYISYGSTYLPTYFYLDLIWPEACCEKSFLQLKQPDIQLVMAIQTGEISCAHIFSCAGSVQASDLSHTYLLASCWTSQRALQVKQHCHVPRSRQVKRTPNKESHADSQEGENLIEMGWTGQVSGLVITLLER